VCPFVGAGITADPVAELLRFAKAHSHLRHVLTLVQGYYYNQFKKLPEPERLFKCLIQWMTRRRMRLTIRILKRCLVWRQQNQVLSVFLFFHSHSLSLLPCSLLSLFHSPPSLLPISLSPMCCMGPFRWPSSTTGCCPGERNLIVCGCPVMLFLQVYFALLLPHRRVGAHYRCICVGCVVFNVLCVHA